MKTLLLLILIVGVFSIKLNKNNHDQTIVGGYSKIDVNNLSKDQKQIDQYLRSNYPQLNNLRLIAGETQVVAGTNYKFTYQGGDNSTYEFVTWDKPWQNYREVTSVKRSKSTVNSLGETVTTVKTVQSNKGTFDKAVNSLFQ